MIDLARMTACGTEAKARFPTQAGPRQGQAEQDQRGEIPHLSPPQGSGALRIRVHRLWPGPRHRTTAQPSRKAGG